MSAGELPADVAREYYIVRVLLKPDEPRRRFAPRWSWLAFDGGYRSHCFAVEGAQRFDKPPAAASIAEYSGCPWFDIHAGPVQMYRVEETRTVTRLDYPVTPPLQCPRKDATP